MRLLPSYPLGCIAEVFTDPLVPPGPLAAWGAVGGMLARLLMCPDMCVSLRGRRHGPSLTSLKIPAHDEFVCGGLVQITKPDPVALPVTALASSNYPAAEMVAMAYVGMSG
ncbi:hypothetical protein AAE478_003451 [Parahypoxylon ruwenzoriense]